MNVSDPTDLSVEAFLALRDWFFEARTKPKSYKLREKGNTQDDPLDEHICWVLATNLPSDIAVVKARGPLITPDLAIHRFGQHDSVPRKDYCSDLNCIIGLEVKKLQRGKSGIVARSTGMDYNTTPPCGTVRIFDQDGETLDIRGFYLFVCQEEHPGEEQAYNLTALALCDGNLLNEDFDYYKSIVGRRTKEIGLGTYGDGANRIRPMTIFANPLGLPFLDQQSTLIHARDDLEREHAALRHIGVVERSVPNETYPGSRTFHCYRDSRDVPDDIAPFYEFDPFRKPKRTRETARRGRFLIDIRPVDPLEVS